MVRYRGAMARPGPEDAGPSRLRGADDGYVPLVPKVSQLDAQELDESLVGMLSEKVEKSLNNFTSSLAFDLKPEIVLALKLVIFRLGVYDSLSSPGTKLVNIHLTTSANRRPSRKRLLLYLLLSPPIFPTYLLTRLRNQALSKQWPDLPPRDWRKKVWKAITRIETLAKVWELSGWLWFLYDGRYPSLLMRILKLQFAPSSSHLTRLVSYEFMNRQLVWSVFTEFLMYSIPLLPPIPRYLSPTHIVEASRNAFTLPAKVDYSSIPLATRSSTAKTTQAHSGILAHLPLSTCPICHLRETAAPVPLSDSASGSQITLPPLPIVEGESPPGLRFLRQTQGHDHDEGDDGPDETRIYVPAESDCWGRCRWCYYCIQGELVRHHLTLRERGGTKHVGSFKEVDQDTEKVEDKWTCLRCGGGVSKAQRIGPGSAADTHGGEDSQEA